MLKFDTDIRFLKGVGEKRAVNLQKMGIDTVGALLRFYPRAYADWNKITDIFDCNIGEKVCVKAVVVSEIREHRIRKNMTLYKLTIADKTGRMPVTVFNNKYLAASLHKGSEYLFSGKVTMEGILPALSSPEVRDVNSVGIKPVYHASGTLSSKAIEKLMSAAIQSEPEPDPLPQTTLEEYGLCGLFDAIKNIHFPKSEEALAAARKRLCFEELFVLQTAMLLLKGKRRAENDIKIDISRAKGFHSLVPYKLTDAQRRAVNDCLRDMSSGTAMNRLVQGDVGSGKTAVAAALMYTVALSGVQSALMAPTEVLAEQHFKSISETLKSSGIKCCLLTGSTSKKERNAIKQQLVSGEAQVAIGTHALFSEDVEFKNLGLVVTDEQHRFGVSQRAALAAKGKNPHTLVMSATPIPRTLALIVYGDLDISIIDEYPRGRQPIDSFVVSSALRPRVFNYIKKHISEGRQAYIVCPMVEENGELPLASAEEYYQKVKDGVFKDYRVGLLHGQMKPREKDAVMLEFKNGELDILVCTTVIEVGIDVPNAAIMLIENAERFGLSQLHQLRGRVGRGGFKSSCIFMSDSDAERLEVIKSTTDGFKIADEDLRLRGPGDFIGHRQHGLPELKIADIAVDSEILKTARQAAENTLRLDPRLKQPENLPLRHAVAQLYKKLNEN